MILLGAVRPRSFRHAGVRRLPERPPARGGVRPRAGGGGAGAPAERSDRLTLEVRWDRRRRHRPTEPAQLGDVIDRFEVDQVVL